MIYHELFGQHLRLGNFLFKYAWSVAKKNQLNEDSCYPEYYLWKYLQNPPVIQQDIPKELPRIYTTWEWSEHEENRVDQFILDNKDVDISLNSFFQSEKWFELYKDEVYRSLKFKETEKIRVYKKHLYCFQKKTEIGIGIRLGDFIGHGDFYQISPDWYISALNTHFPNWENESTVVIFSDDILTAKEIFKEFPFEYAEPNGTETHADNFKHYHGDASEHLILGSLMNDFIIGNSTFSWWQAWLATYNRPLSKVVHSGKVFSETGNMKNIDTTHYYPQNWIKYDT